MKYLSFLLLLASFQTQAFLDPKDCPQEIQDAVETAFQSLSCHDESVWRSNGSARYDLCHVPEHKLIPSIIANAPADQKEFYFLDIGAGNFSWGQNTLEILQGLDLQGKTAHVIGVRGEQNRAPEKKSYGNIHVYELGAMKVENIADALQERLGFDCRDKLDFIATQWTLRHLVNPIGTLVDSYSLLRPGTGKMFFDGFFYSVEDPKEKKTSPLSTLSFLLDQAKVPFLTCQCGYLCTNLGATSRHIISRPSEKPMELSLCYKKITDSPETSVHCKKMIEFTSTAPWEGAFSWATYNGEDDLLGNDAELFKWFQTVEHAPQWKPDLGKKFFDITQHRTGASATN